MRHTLMYRPERWSSFFNNDWNRFFDELTEATTTEQWFEPRVDIQETDSAFLVAVDVPGLRPEDIKMDVNKQTLTIAGERRREHKHEEQGASRFERSFGKFSRQFHLPDTVDTERVEAHLEHGVLQIALPKSEKAKPRSIEIQSGKSEKH